MRWSKEVQRQRREWFARFGLSGREARRLEFAYCAIVDFADAIVNTEAGTNTACAHETICAALREIVDGWEGGA